MWAGLLTFATSKWGKFIGVILAIATLVAIGYTLVSNYNEGIRETQQMKDKNAQLEQVIKDNNEFRKRLAEVERVNDEILIKLAEKNDKVVERHREVNNYLASPEAKKDDRAVSPVIKTTIGILRDERK